MSEIERDEDAQESKANEIIESEKADSAAPEGSAKTFVSKRAKKSHTVIFVQIDFGHYMAFYGIESVAKFINRTLECTHTYARNYKKNKNYRVVLSDNRVLTDLFISYKAPDKLGCDFNDYLRAYIAGMTLMNATPEDIENATDNLIKSLKDADAPLPTKSENETTEQEATEIKFEIKDRPNARGEDAHEYRKDNITFSPYSNLIISNAVFEEMKKRAN